MDVFFFSLHFSGEVFDLLERADALDAMQAQQVEARRQALEQVRISCSCRLYFDLQKS